MRVFSAIMSLVLIVGLSASVHAAAFASSVNVAALVEYAALQQDAPDEETETDRFGVEQPNGFARAELVFWQTLHGVLLGVELCVLLECDDIRLGIGSMVAGGAGGLTLSLMATPNDITSGHAHLINSATMWGIWNALALNIIVEDWGSEKMPVAVMMGGQLAGLGSGIALWDKVKPTAGDIALVNSAGVWSGILSAFAVNTLQLDLNSREWFTTLLASTDVGGMAGGWYSTIEPMGAGRVFIINASGVVGTLFGFGVAVIIQGEEVTDSLMSGAGMLGALAGLGAGWYFTSDWAVVPGEQDAASTVAASYDIELVSVQVAF
jgi:hypothetical protein